MTITGYPLRRQSQRPRPTAEERVQVPRKGARRVAKQRARRTLIYLQALGLLGASSRPVDVAQSWALAGRGGQPCPGFAKHRFTRTVGKRTTKCVRCGSPRPARGRVDFLVAQVAAQWRARHQASAINPRAFAEIP